MKSKLRKAYTTVTTPRTIMTGHDVLDNLAGHGTVDGGGLQHFLGNVEQRRTVDDGRERDRHPRVDERDGDQWEFAVDEPQDGWQMQGDHDAVNDPALVEQKPPHAAVHERRHGPHEDHDAEDKACERRAPPQDE